MVNVLSGSEIEKAAVKKLRDIGKLYNLEEEAEIADKGITELDNQKEVAGREEVKEISLTQEEKEKEKKDLKVKIKKLKKEIERNNLNELIIDRTKGEEEVSNQIDKLSKEFEELDGNEESAGEKEAKIESGKHGMGISVHEEEMGIPRREERPKSKRRGKAKSRGEVIDLSGGSPRRNMLKGALAGKKESNASLLGDSQKQEGVKLYSQLPDYDDFQGYDLGDEDISRQVALGIYANFHKPSWQTLKHHLFTVKITKKLFKKIKELADSDKKGDFKQEMMFGRVAKISIANNSNEVVEMDFVDYGGQATFLHIRDTFSRFPVITFMGTKRKEEKTAEMTKGNVISEW